MKKATLYFNNIRLRSSQTHKFRGYVGTVFAEHDLIHNHDPETGRPIYRYPLIQFKIVDNTPCIIALTDRAVEIFNDIFMSMDEISIEGQVIPVNEKDLKIETVEFGYTQETFMYNFSSPWIALNQNNFKQYIQLKAQEEKDEKLRRILIGNILSMAKSLDVRLSKDQVITTQLQLKETKVTLKGKQMFGFKGIFKTNFQLPDCLGLGKSVSRGYGTVKCLL
jgi:hypothetical protein